MISTRIAGIPCQIEVTHYIPHQPGRTYGPPEHCYPDEPAEISFDVYDKRGYPATWLERKMTERDVERIERLITRVYPYCAD